MFSCLFGGGEDSGMPLPADGNEVQLISPYGPDSFDRSARSTVSYLADHPNTNLNVIPGTVKRRGSLRATDQVYTLSLGSSTVKLFYPNSWERFAICKLIQDMSRAVHVSDSHNVMNSLTSSSNSIAISRSNFGTGYGFGPTCRLAPAVTERTTTGRNDKIVISGTRCAASIQHTMNSNTSSANPQ
jgi:hypothetical protein